VQKLYAVGDIHGDFDKLLAVHALIKQDHGPDSAARIIHVGDLVDRRFKSRQTVQYLLDGQTAGKPWVTLLGNHDRLFLKFLQDTRWKDPVLRPDYFWLHDNMGGRTTLESYGVDVADWRDAADLQAQAIEKVPPEHLQFIAQLPVFHFEAGILFVHAGIRPGVPLEKQSEDDLIWIRGPFHDYTEPHDHLIIHGHTPIDAVTHYGNRINIDTGCAYGRDLSAIVIEDGKIWVLAEGGREALVAGE